MLIKTFLNFCLENYLITASSEEGHIKCGSAGDCERCSGFDSADGTEEDAAESGSAAASASASADGSEAARIRASNDDSETKARLAAAEEERQAALAKLGAKAEPTMLPEEHTFTLEELQACKERTPEMDIDLAQKENYLSDSDFSESFGMGKEEFAALAKWKRTAAKKKVGLF